MDTISNITIDVATNVEAALQAIKAIPDDALYTGYQHPAFLRGWLETGGIDPVFIVLRAEECGPVLLPLQRSGNECEYVGGKHANGNFPIGTPKDIQAIASDALPALKVHEELTELGLDILKLERQHTQWHGVDNPFIDASSVISPNVALSFSINGTFDEVLQNCPGSRKRKKFRNQMRKLEAMGDVAVVIPVGPLQTRQTLERFFNFKAERLKEAGIADVFNDETTQAAFHAMFQYSTGEKTPVHELHMLQVGGEPAAIMGNTVHDGRFTVEFSTFNPAFAHAGPGDLLFFLAVENAVARGLSVFDFGVGDEGFKRSWCDIETWHQDTLVAINARGQLNKLAKTMRTDMVRRLKSNETLWKTAKAARRKVMGG